MSYGNKKNVICFECNDTVPVKSATIMDFSGRPEWVCKKCLGENNG